MTLPTTRPLADIPITPPNPEALSQLAHKRLVQLEDANDEQSIIDTIQAWDHTRRTFETQRLLAAIRFAQNTRDEQHRAHKKAFDDYEPTAQGHEVEFLRELLSSARGCRAAIRAYGHHAVALWRCILLGFEPSITDDKRAEADLITRYNTLRSTLNLVFQGQNHTLSSIRGFYGHADRAIRLESIQAEDTALGTHAETLDALFDDLVKTRHRMAQTLNWPNFITPGYATRRRTDWTPADAQVFRAGVLNHIVPLANKIRARRAETLGISDPAFHDEAVRDLLGTPKPKGDAAWVVERTGEALNAINPAIGALLADMRTRQMLDLDTRDGKVGGGFCELLPDEHIPFILANFTGSDEDVIVLIHEIGHAFQSHRSLGQPLLDYLMPTFETAEIHSMSLEFLAYPEMERIFGDDADRFRVSHLERSVLFLPYACAVDEFQHRVYESPDMTPAERNTLWLDLEAQYMPTRRYQDMPFFQSGRFWQRLPHIYTYPFYYLDYALAQTCALQLWDRSRSDFSAAMQTYTQLCDLGGSQSFTSLLGYTGLDSPFDPALLPRLARTVSEAIGL